MNKTDPKILVWDIETNGVNARDADLGFITCFGYKWLNSKSVKCISLLDCETFTKALGSVSKGDRSIKTIDRLHDDSELLKKAAEVMNQADYLIAHYGDKFDKPFIKTRMLIAGIPPIPDVKQIDTCKLAWNHLKFSRNRLGHLAEVLGCKNLKQEKGNGFPLWWHRAMAGHEGSIRDMSEYCKRDVLALEDIALKLRPYWPRLVKWDLDSQRPNCKTCGSNTIQWRGFERRVTKKWKYHRYQCQSCGSWGNIQELN
jgi:hypothetical protein